MNFDFDILQLMPFVPDAQGGGYVKAGATVIYPEDYVKLQPVLEKRVEIYSKFCAKLQADTGKYVKIGPVLQREVFPYVKFEVTFPEAPQRYVKTAATLQSRGDQYVRVGVRFAIHAEYVKVNAALVKDPIFGEVGDGDPENKTGLLSRQFLSLVSVKKEV